MSDRPTELRRMPSIFRMAHIPSSRLHLSVRSCLYHETAPIDFNRTSPLEEMAHEKDIYIVIDVPR
jgi:hypothetical protein